VPPLVQKGALGAGDQPLARRLDDQACPELVEGVHALTDVIGRPYALILTPGNVSDVNAAPALLERAGRMRYLLGDKGYDADRLRRLFRDVGAVPVTPGRRNRKRTIRYDKNRYAGRHLIENAFCRLKPVLSLSKGTSAGSPPATTNSPPTSSQA